MDLQLLLDKLSHLQIHQIRTSSEEYVELVFEGTNSSSWFDFFNEQFGPPAKNAKARPSKQDKILTEEFGGIWKNQTLFIKTTDDGQHTILAMFWPWGDNSYITLKLAIVSSVPA